MRSPHYQECNSYVCPCAQSLHCVWLFVTPWTAACQPPLSMKFCRQEYWNGLPFPLPGDLPNPEIESVSLKSPALAVVFFTSSTIWEAQAPVHGLQRVRYDLAAKQQQSYCTYFIFLSLIVTNEVTALQMEKQSLNNLPNVWRLVEGLDKILEKNYLTPYNKKNHKSRHPSCIYYSALCTVCHRSMFIHSVKRTSLH